ncbi:MAG: leucine-rich repeat domain-containing protein, partial [Muribaculaceae bacterium]|nr:leucine-rich repeat domain-containing protein [Muribaculaceae bacterium]
CTFFSSTVYNHSFDGSSFTGNLTIPNSVTSIGSYAFYGCSGLTGELTIPNSVTSIGGYAFDGCSGLTGTLTIPNSVTYISEYAFYGCSGLISVTIPNSVNSIGNSAFEDCSGLKDVTIEDGSETLSFGKDAFSNVPIEKLYLGRYFTGSYYPDSMNPFSWHTSLSNLTIGNSVTKIGDDAFRGCSGLKNVIIEDGSGTLSFGDDVFYNVPIETLYLGRNFTCSSSKASDRPFYNKTSLSDLTIGNSVTSIGSSAFYGCSGLTGSLTIPNSVTSIGIEAFDGCSGLTSVTIPNSVTKIGESAFFGCSGLTGSLTIPNSVTSIGGRAFEDCSGLKNVTIEDGPKSLSFDWRVFNNVPIETLYLGRNFTCSTPTASHQPFSYKTSLSSLTIGNSVTSIDSEAFRDCSRLKEVTIEDGSETLSFGNDVFYGVPIKTLYLGRNFTRSHPTYLDSDRPFYGKTSLTNLTISNSVTSIGGAAFYGCSRLTSVTIPNSVTSIGGAAFYGCSGLTMITIGNSVTTISDKAFHDCSGLKEITIPNSVSSIGSSAFNGCSGLTKVILEDGDQILNLEYNYSAGYRHGLFKDCPLKELYLGRNLSYELLPFSDQTKLTTVTIGNFVTRIGSYMFYSCSGLTGSLTIPNSVTSIGECAFEYCSGLTSLTIPNSVTEIGSCAFEGCSGLKEVTFEDGSETLSFGKHAFVNVPMETLYLGRNFTCSSSDYSDQPFYYRTSLSTLTIGYSVTSIGYNAFYGCSGLKKITIEDGSQTLNLGYTYSFGVYNGLFNDCPLKELYLGRNLSYNHSPFNCQTKLTTVTIGNSVTTIGDSAFEGCSGLTSLTIPNSVTEIGEKAFLNCTFNKIICEAITPPQIGKLKGGAFSDETYNVPLIVPNASVPLYKEAFEWEKFTNIIGYDSSGIDEVEADDSTDGAIAPEADVEVYNLRGMLIYQGLWSEARLSKGFYIVRQGYITRKIYVND